ncbi:MAG: TIGR02678 family protein [Streptosporangiaceae bacterium]
MPQVATAGMDAGQRRLAARHLLASPILTAARNPAELELIRRHAAALKSMFATQLGYALVVESTFARLVKAPLPASAPVRAARRGTGDATFTARTYVLLALACAALLAPGVGEQILISALVDQIRADAAEQSVTVTDSIGDRRQLVAALKLLAAWGVVTETDGTLSGWGERPGDEALLSVNRALLIHLLPGPLHQYGTAEETWMSLTAEPPRRRLRQRLVESPAVFRAELPDDELDVLSRERTELARHLDDNFGLVLEVRAEGALAYDPASGSAALTDVDFPGTGSAKQAALLLLDELSGASPQPDSTVVIGGRAVPALLVPWARVSAMLGDLAGRYRRAWKGGYVESPDILLTEVVGLLSGLRLAQPTDGGLAVFPFAARYQPQVTTRPARQTEGYDR